MFVPNRCRNCAHESECVLTRRCAQSDTEAAICEHFYYAPESDAEPEDDPDED